MTRTPTYNELKQRAMELEDRVLQQNQPEEMLVWASLFNEEMLNNLPMGIAYYDDDFVLLKCNRIYANWIRQHTPYDVEEALGMCHFDYKPGSAPYLEEFFRYARDSGRAHTRYDVELHITRAEQDHISYWDAHLAPVMDSSRSRKGLLVCCIDVTERNLVRKTLQNGRDGVSPYLRNLEELKASLRVLLELKEEDKSGLEKKILCNVKQLLFPYIENLKQSRLNTQQLSYLNIIESNLNSIVSPFSHKLSSDYYNFTPMEIRVADLIRVGKISKEIAGMLGVSKECIDFHRNNIRKKLGLNKKKANLRSHLLSLSQIY